MLLNDISPTNLIHLTELTDYTPITSYDVMQVMANYTIWHKTSSVFGQKFVAYTLVFQIVCMEFGNLLSLTENQLFCVAAGVKSPFWA